MSSTTLTKKELSARATLFHKEQKYDAMLECLHVLINEYEDNDARYMLAKYYIAHRINPIESRELLEKAMKRKHFDATFELYKITKDIGFLEKGSGFGSGKCSNELALYHWDTTKNAEKAIELFELAIKQKDKNAVSNYAKILENINTTKSIELYKECVKDKHPTGMWSFARLIYNDIHNSIDLSFMDDIVKDYERQLADVEKKIADTNGYDMVEVCEYMENLRNEKIGKVETNEDVPDEDAKTPNSGVDSPTNAIFKAVDEEFALREKRVKYYETLLYLSSDRLNIYACVELINYYNSTLQVKGHYTKMIQQFQLLVIFYRQMGSNGDEALTKLYVNGIRILAQFHRIMIDKNKEYEIIHQMGMIENYRECIKYCCGAEMETYAQIITEEELVYHVNRADNGNVNEAFFVALYHNLHVNCELMEKYALIASTEIMDALNLLCMYYRNTNNVRKLLEFGKKGIDAKSYFVADLLAKYWKERGNDKLVSHYEKLVVEWKPENSNLREDDEDAVEEEDGVESRESQELQESPRVEEIID